VTVEVHDVEGAPLGNGIGEGTFERLQGRWAEHHQLDPSRDRRQLAQQRPGDHAVAHVARRGGPGDHHQHPQALARDRDDAGRGRRREGA
jgi:hypothetical protein